MWIKSVCLFWIHPTGNLLTHPGISFSTNELWSNKYDIHKSKINKNSLEWITWRILYIKQSNKLKWTSLNTKPVPLPWTLTHLQGNKICMSGLDTSHRQFSNTPKGKFQYQWTLIWSIWTNRSIINNTIIITKTPNKNTSQIMSQRNNSTLY